MTQDEVEAVAEFLQQRGVKVARYHGGLSMAERQEVANETST